MSKFAILCVDDEKMVLNSLKDQLKKHFHPKYLLEFAESTEEALEIITDMQSTGIELMVVISDWLMPGMKGDEFLIKVHSLSPDTAKMLLTGQADEKAIDRVKTEAKLVAMISKPWEEKELVDIIQKCLT